VVLGEGDGEEELMIDDFGFWIFEGVRVRGEGIDDC
jgi:hypothetical protein